MKDNLIELLDSFQGSHFPPMESESRFRYTEEQKNSFWCQYYESINYFNFRTR